ncbi:hypothetical protein PPACK8108_LOCUS12538 [Phakopsora pachyrhizi]|uniref:Uncharacterized protein n=1 Tax=Phakopsora pachyrhizi TaxID=170000 RepID=A0AAV0B351_PHAPC|nr:hypothetical protein PPACK8108_LOCUS12538 [Phakopsora pachyrhizi]
MTIILTLFCFFLQLTGNLMLCLNFAKSRFRTVGAIRPSTRSRLSTNYAPREHHTCHWAILRAMIQRIQSITLTQQVQLFDSLKEPCLQQQKAFNPKINGNENQIRRLSKDSLGDGVDWLWRYKGVSWIIVLISGTKMHLPESLYPSETNGQITFGNHALDLSQLQPAPESERSKFMIIIYKLYCQRVGLGEVFSEAGKGDLQTHCYHQTYPKQLLKEGQVRHHYNYIYFPKDYLNRTWSTNSKRRGKSKNQIYLLVELIQNATEQWKLKVSRQSKDLKGVFPVIFSTRSIQQSLHLTLPNPSDLWGFDALFSTYIARLIKKRKVSIDLTKGIVDFIRAYSNGIGGEVLDNLISWVDDWEGDLKEWFNWSERNLVKINTTATNNVKGEMMLKEDYIRFDSAKAIASELTLEI